jgi:ferrochelatase
MTPYELLRRYDENQYNSDNRMVNGQFFPSTERERPSGS